MNLFRTLALLGTGALVLTALPLGPRASGQQPPPPGSPAPGTAGAPGGSGAPGSAGGSGPLGAGGMGRLAVDPKALNAPRTLAPYFVPATAAIKAPDADGFLQRWLLLEPISKPNRSNNLFVGTYVRAAFNTQYFPDQFTVIPRSGDKVNVGEQQLAWHAVDSTKFDVNLFRFAYGLNKPTYGVIFWAVTIVNSPREMKNVRMAVGSNSASMWWLNGADVADLFDDRRMVMDDVVSRRITLNKGQNILRGAVINGPGLSDFCVRFLDDRGEPIKGITLSLK